MDKFNIIRARFAPTMEIDVRQEDIDNATCGSFTNCPIARAVRRRTSVDEVSVDAVGVLVKNSSWQLPIAAKKFMANFDDGKAVEPRKFTLTYAEDAE